jgi:peptide/nickel transport system ATP-binding protein
MTTPKAGDGIQPLLDVRGLRTVFDGGDGPMPAVDGVSFSVGRGESVGLVGESGCGKTVTALSLMGLVPDPPGRVLPGGSVRLDGTELLGLSRRDWRRVRGRRVGMVFQEPMSSLNPVIRVGDLVAEVVRAHGHQGRAAAHRRAVELLTEVGLGESTRIARRYPHELSGGMRQRVMLAMALAADPELLIADEPTTALDVTIQAQILDLLELLRRRRGMALLLITHDLAVVSRMCERVLVMYAGQVVEAGPVARVFSAPRHPYTKGLIQAVRRVEPGSEPLPTLPGRVPAPGAWPQGCRFRDRCPESWDQCGQEAPPLFEVDDREDWTSRCWLEDEPRDDTDRQEASE